MRATEQLELAALITQQGYALLPAWRQQVKQLASARNLDTPTLNDHIPQLLDELADALNSKSDRKISGFSQRQPTSSWIGTFS
jgi:hypothetical protein